MKPAGVAYMTYFLTGNPTMFLCRLGATSTARARGFNNNLVSAFYELLEVGLTIGNAMTMHNG